MLARQLAYITYVRGSMSTLQILLFLYFYGFMPPTLSREEPVIFLQKAFCGEILPNPDQTEPEKAAQFG